MKKWIILGVIVAVIAALFLQAKRPQPLRVSAVAVERGDVIASVTNTRAGTVDACRRARIAAAAGGNITALYVDDGKEVAAGELLLEIWNDDLKAHLQVAEADAAASKSLSRQACVTAEVARRTANRLVQLREEKVASEDAVEKAVGEADSAEAACAASHDAAAVKTAAVSLARATLQRTQLRAPFAGVIAEINGELGEFVTPSPIGVATLPTVDLIDNTCLFIRAPIDEVDAPEVRVGHNAWISLDAFGDRRFAGHVTRVAPYVLDLEKQSRTVDVEAVIDDPNMGLLLPGYSADIEVILDERHGVLYVPTPVILEDGSVFVIPKEGGKVEKRTIKTGLRNWERTEVVDGLAQDDWVVRSIDREGLADGVVAEVE